MCLSCGHCPLNHTVTPSTDHLNPVRTLRLSNRFHNGSPHETKLRKWPILAVSVCAGPIASASARQRQSPTIKSHTTAPSLRTQGGLSSGNFEAAATSLGVARIAVISYAVQRLLKAGHLARSGASVVR